VRRRDWLRMAGLAVGGAAVARVRLVAETGPVMDALAAYMGAAADKQLLADVIEHAKHHILDTLAAMISGTELAPGQAAIRYARM